MSKTLTIARNKASTAQITALLEACDFDFSPPLSERLDIVEYAHRICERAERFEYWISDTLVGLVAMYCITRPGDPAFVTNVSVYAEHRGSGIAQALMRAAISHARAAAFGDITLEVDEHAVPAQRLYQKLGFQLRHKNKSTYLMELSL